MACHIEDGNRKRPVRGLQCHACIELGEFVWIITSQPLEAGGVFTLAQHSVHYNPDAILHHQHGTAVDTVAAPLVAIVLSLGQCPERGVLKAEQLCLRPVQRLELAEVEHLVPTIHHDCIVAFGTQEVVVPKRRSVVTVTAGVNQYVLSAPPDIQMEHVDLREPVQDGAAAECREVGRIGSTEDMVAGVLERY